jgi:hypothetical protein
MRASCLKCWPVMAALVWCVGCGGGSPPAGTETTPAAVPDSSTTSQRTAPGGSGKDTAPPPSEVVALFLDSVRRGDESVTLSLLTDLAQQEIRRSGLEVAPIGSPEARFTIGQVRYVEHDPDGAFVECMWSEPLEGSAEGMNTEVVWALRRQAGAWKVAGMAIDLGAEEEPLVIDFEDSQDLMALAGGEEPAATAQPQTDRYLPDDVVPQFSAPPAAQLAQPPLEGRLR